MRRRVFLKEPAKPKKNCEICNYPHSFVQILKKKEFKKVLPILYLEIFCS